MSLEPAHPKQDPMIGRVLLGRYRIVRELAKGGMGVVYLARAEGAAGFVKPVVVKLILRELASDQRYVGMFAREAQILANLRDPSIVDVIEFDQQDGDYVMVLEYVRGYHLGQWKRYLKRVGREVPTDIILQLTIDVLQALHHAHTARHPDGESMQIVHRDVSPANILLDGNGRARLLDFGVARMRGGSHGYQTKVKGFVGKYPYIAPEIFAGQEASTRSDLYSTAVVLHETLIGHNVFRAETEAATLQRVMNHHPEPVSAMRDDVPDALDAVLDRALAKDPMKRFRDAANMADALRGLQPDPEHEVRARLANLLREDFSDEMATMLKLESLSQRDAAWQRLSQPSSERAPEAPDRTDAHGVDTRVSFGDKSESRLRSPKPQATRESERPTRYELQSDADETVVSSVEPERPEHAGLEQPESEQPESEQPEPELPIDESTRPGKRKAKALPSDGGGVMQPSAPQQRSATHPAVLGALAFVGALAAVAIMLSLRAEPQTSSAPQIQVVQKSLAPAAAATPSEGQEAPPATPETEAAAVALEMPTGSIGAATASQRRKARTTTSSSPDAASLTRAFRSQQPQIHRCFSKHAAESSAQPKVEIEFTIAPDGALRRTRVLPASLADSALGRCVQSVAGATRFPGQGETLTFAIPVTARVLNR